MTVMPPERTHIEPDTRWAVHEPLMFFGAARSRLHLDLLYIFDVIIFGMFLAACALALALTPTPKVPAAAAKITPAAVNEKDDAWPLLKQLRQACFDYSLIEPNDKIAVAVIGGKDSSTLAYLLQLLHKRRMLPFDWSFVTMHLDQVQPGHDPSSLQEWCESLGIEFHLLREDTYSIVKEKTKEGSSYCSLCSRLRRGILYTAAEDLGCNCLALGHHRDDALETLLMNMCHQGQTALPAGTLPAWYRGYASCLRG